MENTKNTGNISGSGDSNAAAFMADLLQKLGGPEEAMKAFAMFTTMMEQTAQAASTSAAPPPPKISGASPPQPEAVHTVAETTAADIRGEETDLAAGLELLAVSEPRKETLGTSVSVDLSVVLPVSITEGETHVAEKFEEGETPGVCVSVSEGDEALISEEAVEGETLEVFWGQ
ncbi:uncharacterized protein LOC121765508 [Salvia splendens]|uniref:uncharacterized protein LOC121765508 n=1 Tax=Salvia splendens TaxID=180675 RepID=UPI001C2614D0|nr:uncharacterized protein LOC121765508 [Salvia splendens]